MKPKRKKPFAANLASRKKLEAEGWTVEPVERTIPHTFIKKDLFGFADLLAISPSRGVLFVQATGGASTSNLHARLAKLRTISTVGIVLGTYNCRIQVHNWKGKGNVRECQVVELQPSQDFKPWVELHGAETWIEQHK